MLRCLAVGLCALSVVLPLTVDGQVAAGAPALEGIGASMDVVVAADGSVASVTPDAALSAPIRAGLIRRVSQWRYSVPMWQGRAVSLGIRLGIRLQPVPTTSGGFALRIIGEKYVPDPDPQYRMKPPRYPRHENRFGRGGVLVYTLRVDTAGGVSDVRLVYPDGPLDSSGKAFDLASREAFAAARFRPVLVDGTPVACTRSIPITFTAAGNEPPAAPDLDPLKDDPQKCPQTTLQTRIEGVLL